MSPISNVANNSAAVFHWARSEVSYLLRFIKRPTCQRQCIEDRFWALRSTYLSILTVVCLIPIAYSINLLQEFFYIKESKPSGILNLTNVIFVLIFAPLLEEILFRGGIRIPFASVFLTPLITMAALINSEQRLLIFFAFLTITAIVATAHWKYLFGKSKGEFEQQHSKKFHLIFWANCAYFSLSHLSNFDLSGLQIIICWLLVTPQFLFGIIFSYLRLQNGIKSAVLSHVIINIIGFSAYSAQASL